MHFPIRRAPGQGTQERSAGAIATVARGVRERSRRAAAVFSVCAFVPAARGMPSIGRVGAAAVSRWDLGLKIAAHLGVDEQWLQPVMRADTPEVSARRPRDVSLRSAPLDQELGIALERLPDAIAGLARPPWARELPARLKR